MALSFADEAFDLVVSNDVIEHVPEPNRALGEFRRILRPGGELYLTTPFHAGLDANRRRAKESHGVVEHLEDAAYHYNPLDSRGSLVFTDFGWELLGQMEDAGFRDVALVLYWSHLYGHLGVPSSYIHGVAGIASGRT